MTTRMACILLCCMTVLAGCPGKKEPVLIGLSVNLSGKGGTAGEYIREGVMLAVDEVNRKNGINGRPLKLIVRDDKNSDEGIIQSDKELMNEGVVAIIGHTYSDSTLKAHPHVMANGKTLLITGYTATDTLTAKDDLFFRTSVSTSAYSDAAVKLFAGRNIKTVNILQDKANSSFSDEITAGLARRMDSRLIRTVAADSRKETDWDNVVNRLLQSESDAILMLTEVGSTGIAAQKLRAAGYRGELIATIWCQTPDLIRFGGEAVEGMTILSFIDPENRRPAYLKFAEKIEKRFNKAATARTDRGYELVTILAEALKKSPGPTAEELKAALLAGQFETLLGTVRFDRFGDVQRPVYAVRIKGMKFVNGGEIK